MDLSKQVGPLPLGAWIAVVAVGGGIAWYSRRQSDNAPTIVEDTSGTPGVGVGGSGAWTEVGPSTTTGNTAPTTNEAWATKMVQWMIAMGYDPVKSQTAVTKYLNAGKLDAQEYTLVTLAMAVVGPPPQQLGYSPDDPSSGRETVLYYLEGSKPATWALANGPNGGWVETNSQIQANAWAVAYSDNKMATHVTAASWASLKAKWGGS